MLALLIAHLEQRERLRILRHQHIPHVLGKALNKQSAIEALIDNRVKQHHDIAYLIINREVDDLEVILCIQHVEILDHLVVSDIPLTERGGLVEDRESIAHTAISLLCDDGERLLFVLDALFLSDGLQMVDRITDGHPLEVIDLTTTEDGGQDLVFLRRGEDEDDMCGRLLKCLKEGIESRCREHVHLVDNKDLVSAKLWRDARLFHQCLDMFHTVVRGGIELEDVQRALFIERLTAFAFVTGFSFCCRILAIDGFGENTGTSCFSYATRSAEEVSMSQFSTLHGILQGGGECRLPYDGIEGYWTVLTC